MRGDRRVNRFHLGNIRLYLHDRRTRRYSPYFMFPEYTISPPPMVTFYMNVKSEVGSYEAMSLVNPGSMAVKKPSFKLSNGSLDVSSGQNAYVTRSCNGAIEIIKAVASVNSGLLMAVMGLLFPAVLHATHTELHFGKSELALSRFSSYIMLVAYAAYLYFQLKSQRQLRDQVMSVLRKQEKHKNQPHQAKDNQETELRILLKSKEPGKSLVG
ncbi:hypothetical protein WN943_004038 [Citrus x changshan-huyou]